MSGIIARGDGQQAATLSRYWLAIGRAAWCVVFVISVSFVMISLPSYIRELVPFWATNNPAPPEVIREGLDARGIPTGVYTGFGVSLLIARTLVCYLIGAILFWRKSAERMVLLVATLLVSLPAGDTDPRTLSDMAETEPVRAALAVTAGLVTFTLVYWLFLVFPDGRFTPRWTRWVALVWLAFGTTAIVPGIPLDTFSWPALFGLSIIPSFAVLAIAVQIWRYRHISGALERQQTKWFILGFSVVLIEFALGDIVWNGILAVQQASPANAVIVDLLMHTVHSLAFMTLPLTLAVAMLRHRLWDFDRLITRAALYAILTAILAAIYLGGVVLLQGLLRAITGQASKLAIAATTLAVAALIQPLRQRLQTGIDRRFARRKYDAARILVAFGETLRDETDARSIQAGLLHAVDRTMQPQHISLWLRPPPSRLPPA